MNRLRTGGQARISFFSFQDIITSVTGILILVTLMLSFSVQTGDPQSTEEQRLQSALQTARARLGEIESENEVLQRRRLEATTLPDRAQLQTQIETLRRDQAELGKQREQSAATLASALLRLQNQTATPAQLREETSALEVQLRDLRQKASQAKTNVNAVYIVPDAEARQNPKKPLAIVVGGDRLRSQRLSGAEVQDLNITSVETLQPVLARYNPERDLLIFYFRPSGAKWFESFRSMARQSGFEVGYDAVEEQKEIIFSAQ